MWCIQFVAAYFIGHSVFGPELTRAVYRAISTGINRSGEFRSWSLVHTEPATAADARIHVLDCHLSITAGALEWANNVAARRARVRSGASALVFLLTNLAARLTSPQSYFGVFLPYNSHREKFFPKKQMLIVDPLICKAGMCANRIWIC
jgi:hypothetical protein